MAPSPVNTIAAKIYVPPVKADILPVVRTVPRQNRAKTVRAQGAPGSLHGHFSRGKAAIVGGMIGQPVAVEQATRTVGKGERDQSGIRARDRRIDPARIGGDSGDLAHQVSEGVDRMNGGFVGREPRQIGIRSLAIAGPKTKGQLK